MKNIHNQGSFLLIFFLFTACQSQPYKQGETLYRVHCENCHMEDGSGLVELIPSLGSSVMLKSDPETLICLIRNGIPMNPSTGQEMPGNKLLNEVELANLSNYLRTIHSGDMKAITVSDVTHWLKTCD